jgi:hypothetical protein
MRAVAHRRFIDIVRDWFRHLFHPTTVEHDSVREFERFFGE